MTLVNTFQEAMSSKQGCKGPRLSSPKAHDASKGELPAATRWPESGAPAQRRRLRRNRGRPRANECARAANDPDFARRALINRCPAALIKRAWLRRRGITGAVRPRDTTRIRKAEGAAPDARDARASAVPPPSLGFRSPTGVEIGIFRGLPVIEGGRRVSDSW